MTEKEQLDLLLAQLDEWYDKTKDATNDPECAECFTNFFDAVEPVRLANGHPTGRPTRKLG